MRPEEVLEQLAARRVDYYFGRITQHTDRMTDRFRAVYARAAGRQFAVVDMSQAAQQFLPTVIKTMTTSMTASRMFV